MSMFARTIPNKNRTTVHWGNYPRGLSACLRDVAGIECVPLFWVCFFGMILIRINDPRSPWSWYIKWTAQSFPWVEFLVPLMCYRQYDPRDLRLLILIILIKHILWCFSYGMCWIVLSLSYYCGSVLFCLALHGEADLYRNVHMLIQSLIPRLTDTSFIQTVCFVLVERNPLHFLYIQRPLYEHTFSMTLSVSLL